MNIELPKNCPKYAICINYLYVYFQWGSFGSWYSIGVLFSGKTISPDFNFFWCHSSLCRLRYQRLPPLFLFSSASPPLCAPSHCHCRHSPPPSLSAQSSLSLPLLHHLSLWDLIILQKMRTTLNLGRCCMLVWSSKISDMCLLGFKRFCISDQALYVSSIGIFCSFTISTS